MLSISYVGSNLVVDSFQCFGLKLGEKKMGKVNNLPTVV